MIDFAESIHGYVTGDFGMEALCDGTVRMFLGRTDRAPAFPYQVFLLKGELDDDGVTMRGQLLIDVWDCAPTATRAWQIAKLLKLLLHNHSDPELNGAGLFFQGMDPVATDDPEVWRVALRFEAWWPDTDLAQYTG